MKNKTAGYLILFTFLFLVFAACEEDDNGESYNTATVDHNGFDFSVGKPDTVNYQNNDGETIIWQPGGEDHPDYPDDGDYIWWRNSNVDEDRVNKTMNMGKVSLSSVEKAPSSWDQSPAIPPLLKDHVIVARCKDGYVKFKVVETDASGIWAVRIKYLYSESSSFKD